MRHAEPPTAPIRVYRPEPPKRVPFSHTRLGALVFFVALVLLLTLPIFPR